MKPYYEDETVTLYHADCREVLPALTAGMVLTDPPYNAGKDYEIYKDNLSAEEYEAVMGEVVRLCRCAAPNQGWIAPRYKLALWLKFLPDAHMVVVRRGARGPFRGGWSDQFGIVLTVGKPARCEIDLWDDIRLKGEGYFFREETYGHPGYTPLPIFVRLAELLGNGSLIDPFCGTGTGLIAARKIGIKGIGIELNERYCEIAAQRLQRETVLNLSVD
jgi:hypothetical protein